MSSIAHIPAAGHEALRRDKLTLMLDATGEGIYGIDLTGGYPFINRAGAAMLGYTPDEVLGHSMHELIHHTHENGQDYLEKESAALATA